MSSGLTLPRSREAIAKADVHDVAALLADLLLKAEVSPGDLDALVKYAKERTGIGKTLDPPADQGEAQGKGQGRRGDRPGTAVGRTPGPAADGGTTAG
jgi:hypothetical protein